MLLETLLRHLLQLYLATRVDKAPLLLETLQRISRACSTTAATHNHPATPNHTLSMRAIASPIIPGKLYLSGITAASTPETLREHGITHVLSIVTPSEAPTVPAGIEHLVIPLSDTTTTNLLPHLPQIVAFISKAIDGPSTNKVLVHCVEGISRSASAVIAYLMAERGMSFAQALRVVKRRRAIVSPNLGFVRQLSEWGSECEERRRERPREWEQLLRKRKAECAPQTPPVRVEKIRKLGSWMEWAFGGWLERRRVK